MKSYKMTLIVNAILGVFSSFLIATGLLNIFGLLRKPTMEEKNIGMTTILSTVLVVFIINLVMYMKKNTQKTIDLKFVIVSLVAFLISFIVPYIIYYIWLWFDDYKYLNSALGIIINEHLRVNVNYGRRWNNGRNWKKNINAESAVLKQLLQLNQCRSCFMLAYNPFSNL